jgi:cystathionine gamma-synthase
MIIRGLKTMALRVETQNRTSLRMARLLENHPKIEHVYYPGLKSSPCHHIAKSQMTGFGGVLSFEVASDLHGVMRFIDALEIPFIATSLGGCESLVQQPAVMSFWGKSDEEKGKNGIKDNLVRFSFGIEKFEDLRDDILQALEKI